jgi:hypothetical protein
MEQTTISIDVETARKLKDISETSHISQTEILREFISACFTVLESLDVNRISFGSLANISKKKVETFLLPLLIGRLDPSTLDSEIDSRVRAELEKHEKRIEKK